MSIQSSITSATTPASGIAGPLRSDERRRLRWAFSLAAKTTLLAVIFVLVPIILYVQFREVYEEDQQLILKSVRDEGRAISQSLLPLIENADMSTLPQLGAHLARFSGEVTTIKLLFAPTGTGGGSDGFFYVASWPAVQPGNLEAEREILQQQGVLDRLAQNCRGELPFSLFYTRPTGGAEIVTAVTPLPTVSGCWAVVSSFSAEAFPSIHLGQPYWATPTVRIAALVYLVMAALTFSTLFSLRSGLRRFARRARQIREEGPGAVSFAFRNDIPELADVAAEFDRMVGALRRSAADTRRAAEDNAHAFKTPIAVMRQSLEPLRRALPADNQRALRAIGLFETSLDRLDGLVASARRLDEATADLFAKPRAPLDLQPVVGRLIQTQTTLLGARKLAITGDLMPGIVVIGDVEMIETVLENLVDNAISFSPEGSEILIRLTRQDDEAEISVSDRGPGVPDAQLERIFERYFSERHEAGIRGSDAPATYFGIGLWIARRNVEALGGRIWAENRAPHGLTVRIRLPLAPDHA